MVISSAPATACKAVTTRVGSFQHQPEAVPISFTFFPLLTLMKLVFTFTTEDCALSLSLLWAITSEI
jgi:hypothetical protein